MSIKQELSEKLKSAAERKQLSRVCKKANVALSTALHVRSGEGTSLSTAERLAEAMGYELKMVRKNDEGRSNQGAETFIKPVSRKARILSESRAGLVAGYQSLAESTARRFRMRGEQTLDEFMRECQVPVSIGSKSNYFFIGTPQEYETQIDECYEEYKKRLENGIVMLAKRVHNAEEWLKGLERKAERNEEEEESYKRLRREVPKLKENLRDKKRLTITITDFRQRKVEEVYPRVTEPGVAVIVEGHETGDYWNYGEMLEEEEE